MSKAHPSDVLIVGTLQESLPYHQFHKRQVISTFSLQQLYARRLGRVFYTASMFEGRRADEFVAYLERCMRRSPHAVLIPIEDYDTAPAPVEAGEEVAA